MGKVLEFKPTVKLPSNNVSKDSHSEETSYQQRLENIRTSIQKINNLMSELGAIKAKPGKSPYSKDPGF